MPFHKLSIEGVNAPEAGSDSTSSDPAVAPLRIALVHALNPNASCSINKDLNGGLGTSDNFGRRFTSRLIMSLRRHLVRLPIISFAYLQGLLRAQGHEVRYFEGSLPSGRFDVVLVYGSLVDHRNENETCASIKRQLPDARVGIFGPFPSRAPAQFDQADFVLLGEADAFFLHEFRGVDQLVGHVPVTSVTDLDALPSPSLDGFPLARYRYAPALVRTPFFTLQASRGCPYSCRHYCTYGEYQGATLRVRSPRLVADDMAHLHRTHGIRSVQFRDAVFGLKPGWISELCGELRVRALDVRWGMETRLDLLTEETIDEMAAVGLRNVNVGIETTDVGVAKRNRRPLVEHAHQERIVRHCERRGVKVSALYILGLEGDTEASVHATLAYARRLNTHLARFSVATPYPGTGFFDQLVDADRITTHDYEQYTQFNLVFRHEHFTREALGSLLEEAYARYYFRPAYLGRLARWKLRQLRL